MKSQDLVNELKVEFWRILEAKQLKISLLSYKGNNLPGKSFLLELDRFTTNDVVLAFRRLLQVPDKKTICLESALLKMKNEKILSRTCFQESIICLDFLRRNTIYKNGIKKIADRGGYAHNDSRKTNIGPVSTDDVEFLYSETFNYFYEHIYKVCLPDTSWAPKPNGDIEAILLMMTQSGIIDKHDI